MHGITREGLVLRIAALASRDITGSRAVHWIFEGELWTMLIARSDTLL